MQKENKRKLYLAAAVGLITLIVYLPALWNEFVYWDDNVYIFENPYVRSLGPAFFRWAFTDFYAGNWHPLTWISHALDSAFWGLNPAGHHLTNIVLHAANAFLVVLLVIRLLEVKKDNAGETIDQGFPDTRGILIAAASAGLLFGVHPLHVESVAWVSERKDLLCAFFFLLSMSMYIKYAAAQGAGSTGRREDRDRRSSLRFRVTGKRYLAALALFVLALLSKPMAVSLPAVLLVLDWYPLNRIGSWKSLMTAAAEKVPFLALSLVSSLLTVNAQRTVNAFETVNFIPLSVRVLVAAKSLIAYVGKMIIPVNLFPFYPYPNDVSFGSFEYWSALALVIAVSAACLALIRKQKFWLAVWACYIVTLIPVIGIVHVGGQSMADRYTYLPSIGPFLVIGVGTARIFGKMQRAKRGFAIATRSGAVAALILLVSLSYLTIKQIGVWRNSIVLWTYEIENRAEKIPIAYVNRGVAFYRKGLLDKAAADYETAITLDPSAFRPYVSLGSVFEDMGLFDMARENFDKAIAVEPSSHEAYRKRGMLYEKIGRFDEAIADFTRAVALKPSYFDAYNNRGIVFAKLGQFEKAIADYDETIRIYPLHFGAHANRGIAYTLMGQYERAVSDFNKAILLSPDNPSGYFNRALFYKEIGDNELSRADFQHACDLGNETACRALRQVRQRVDPGSVSFTGGK